MDWPNKPKTLIALAVALGILIGAAGASAYWLTRPMPEPPSAPVANRPDPLVVIGAACYHRPGCPTLRPAERLPVTVDEAVGAGLRPCRVCRPGP